MFLSAWVGATLSFFDGTAKMPPHPQPDRNPVLLIHGIADSERNMRWLAHYLRREGWEVHTLSLKPNWAQKGLEPLAGQIDAYARAQFGTRRFDLVGFSMGGLVSRYYVQRLGGLDRVDHLVTLSAPHNGTILANLIPQSRLPGDAPEQRVSAGSRHRRGQARDLEVHLALHAAGSGDHPAAQFGNAAGEQYPDERDGAPADDFRPPLHAHGGRGAALITNGVRTLANSKSGARTAPNKRENGAIQVPEGQENAAGGISHRIRVKKGKAPAGAQALTLEFRRPSGAKPLRSLSGSRHRLISVTPPASKAR
ncbi:MAG: alpha/beta fold hydrolase [Chthoniobacter sp.]